MINKIALFKELLDILKVDYIDPCSGDCLGIASIPTHIVPITVECPLVFPIEYDGNTCTTSGEFEGFVQDNYPDFFVTLNLEECTFTFIGVGMPPVIITITI